MRVEKKYDRYEDAKKLGAKDNMIMTKFLAKNKTLGPEVVDPKRNGNTPYYALLSKATGKPIREARRIKCGNCRYGSYEPEAIAAMEHIPDTPLDLDGGGRVWCDKFDFICHNLRVCEEWED